MEIESVQVIPMLKDSKWEDTNRIFEVSMITTDYATWFTSIYEEILSFVEIARPETDENCVNFAKRQQAFMVAPTAMFGSSVYVVKTITADNLIDIVIDGPLYKVNVFMVDDMSAEKTVERKYVDPVSFMPMYGLWYPQKKTYKVRYGALWCAV
jgi:hypothetical protein